MTRENSKKSADSIPTMARLSLQYDQYGRRRSAMFDSNELPNLEEEIYV